MRLSPCFIGGERDGRMLPIRVTLGCLRTGGSRPVMTVTDKSANQLLHRLGDGRGERVPHQGPGSVSGVMVLYRRRWSSIR